MGKTRSVDLSDLILSALAEGPTHGYAIARRLDERSEGVLKAGDGQLYPLLRRMEADGWIEAELDDRERRIYRLTDLGMGKLAESRAKWAQYRLAVDRMMGAA